MIFLQSIRSMSSGQLIEDPVLILPPDITPGVGGGHSHCDSSPHPIAESCLEKDRQTEHPLTHRMGI